MRRQHAFLFVIVAALLALPVSAKQPGPGNKCLPLDSAQPALLGVGEPVYLDLKDGVFKIGSITFLTNPKQSTMREFMEFFRSLPLGLKSTVAVRIEPIPEEATDLPSKPPEMSGVLERFPKTDQLHVLFFGGKNYDRELSFTTNDPCVKKTIEQYYTKAVKLIFSAPFGT